MSDQERLLDSAKRLLEGGKDARDDQALEAAHPSDIAATLQRLPLDQQVALFRRLSPERAGEVLPGLDDTTLLALVRALDEAEVSRILDEMPVEHAADVVEELHRDEAAKILELMEEGHSEDVQEILEYPEHSAGRLMSPDFVAVREDATVEEAIKHIRDSIAVERAFELYVVDGHRHLVGVVDIVGEEATEDIFRMAGSDAAELERRTPQQIALMRLPWVMATLVIELGAGAVIHYFDQTLGKVILLASFMPVIQAISGNTGLQSVTMVVRGLATGQLHLSRWWEPLRRQVQTSSILGGVCALVVGSVGLLWHSPAFGLVVALSMFASVNLSGFAGTMIHMLSKRLGFDPAITAGPFETALQDVLGVTIFLSLATALLSWLS